MPVYEHTNVRMWRCCRCGFLALSDVDMRRHRIRAIGCRNARAVTTLLDSISFHDPLPADTTPPMRRGPKPRDYAGFFRGRLSAEDIESRIALLAANPSFMEVLRGLPLSQAYAVPGMVFRAAWGEEAPPEAQSMALLAYRYAMWMGTEVKIVGKREELRSTMARQILVEMVPRLPGLPQALLDTVEHLALVVESRGRYDDAHTVYDATMTSLAREFLLITPSTSVPKK